MRWISKRDLEVDAALRLFCLPHAGSGAAGFYRWKRLLAPGIAVCPVLLPGREGRFAEPPRQTVADIVSETFEELAAVAGDKPFALYGHSMGSLLAFELACALPRGGPRAPRALIVSGRAAPVSAARHGLLHRLDDQDFVNALRDRYGEHGAALLRDPELRALFLPVLRADLEVVETYAPAAHAAPLSCPVAAFAGTRDCSVSDQELEGWRGSTTGRFFASRLAGDHFFQFADGQAALLDAIRRLAGGGRSSPAMPSPPAG